MGTLLRTRTSARVAIGSLLVAAFVAASPAPASAEPLPGTTCSFFPANSVFNTDVSSAQVNAQSATWMTNMAQNPNLHPDFGTFAQEYGIPINAAPPPSSGLQPTFAFDSESDHPAEGYPISPTTNIEGGPSAPSGSDRHALVVDSSRCKLYEIYNLQNFTAGQKPSAGSGATWDLGSDAMRPNGWTSADAAGLPIAPLLLRPDEILAGSITHAIRFTTHCTNGYIWPASHQAGLCSTGFPPMGARFRLKKTFDISTFSASAQVVLTAFQHYGLILADNGADWYFQGTTDDWWGTTAGSSLVSELKTIPASQFDAVDESGLQVAAGSYQAVQSRASALPLDRLHFGLANGPSDLSWMTSSGVPWRYRYAYLAGGVNTGSGWETWNSPAGAYASLYMNASGANGYIPVFSYYDLLQSTPSTGSNESDRDYSNLNNASTMAAYYANFKLLMQDAGAYGKTVVVQVEPDLWGYLEQRAAGGAASSLSASVASSGFAEAAGLPNTAAGFAYELLKLRDTYAPNTVLAIHASPWGSGVDIASDRRTAVNPLTEADTTAAFLNSAGLASNPYGSTWDLVFNDVDDHDAGWWEAQGADNSSFTHWWDPTNATYPNFNRYLAWVGELHAKTSRPQVVWQVPEGNQYYLTMNNTCGHYQDNLAQYFIANASSLYSAGLIAVLFGAGNACQTNNTDAQHDGITNNGGVPTTDALGYCSACNTHTSTSTDDDGGFLRQFVGQYYASPGCSVTVSVPASETSTQFGVGLSAGSCAVAYFEVEEYDATLNQGWFGMPTVAGSGGSGTATAQGFQGHDYQFMARAHSTSGLVSAWSAVATTQVATTASQSHPWNGVYTVDDYGGVHPADSPPLTGSAYWPGWKIVRAAKAEPGSSDGGLVLDGYGGLHSYGAAVSVNNTASWPGWDIARDFAFLPDGTGGYVLDGYGGLHPFALNGHALPPAVSGAAYWRGWDIARKVVIFGDGTGGYVMDGYGGLHPFGIGGAVPAGASGAAYWPGWQIARDLVLVPGSHGGYVLDGYGGLHPFNGAPGLAAPAYWPGWNIARSVWLLSSSTLSAPAGYVLDGYGGMHPFGGAPAIASAAYWAGSDLAHNLCGA